MGKKFDKKIVKERINNLSQLYPSYCDQAMAPTCEEPPPRVYTPNIPEEVKVLVE